MRKVIDNKIVFDDAVKCEKCGVVGAYDCTTTFLCDICMPRWNPISNGTILSIRIDNYLQNGGLFNPEMMEHNKVRQLLIDCREALSTNQNLVVVKKDELERDKSTIYEALDMAKAFLTGYQSISRKEVLDSVKSAMEKLTKGSAK